MITFRNAYHGYLCRIDEIKALEHIEKNQLVLLLNKEGRRLYEGMPYQLRPKGGGLICKENICERPRFSDEASYRQWDDERLAGLINEHLHERKTHR